MSHDPAPKIQTFAKAIGPIVDELESWGLANTDWILTGQYVYRLLGYQLPIRPGHHNILVDRTKLPWPIPAEVEETFPVGADAYAQQYRRLLAHTGHDFDLLLHTPAGIAKRRVDATQMYQIPDGRSIYIQTELGQLEGIAELMAKCDDQGWGVEKGQRLLAFVEQAAVEFERVGKTQLGTRYQAIAKRFAHLKTEQPLIATRTHQSPHRPLQGNVVSAGGRTHLSGRACVVRQPSAEVEPGHILVVQSTNPHFVPLMRQAAALISDHGGLMSHAAIIARELNLPCIVGTKHATELIHNGDTIELNLVTGQVTILNL